MLLPNPTIEAVPEIDRVRKAFATSLAAIQGVQAIGRRYIYGEPGQWHSLGLAQQRLDEFGSDTAKLFAVSGKLAEVTYMMTGEIPVILPPGVEYTINADGTVALSGVIQPEAEVILG